MTMLQNNVYSLPILIPVWSRLSHMKYFACLLFWVFISHAAAAQLPVNYSFENHYQKKNIKLQYKCYLIGPHENSANEKNPVHDYSGNWDFDGDGKNDGVKFIGTGGAHLYYYLKVELSSGKSFDLTFINSDMPMFQNSLKFEIPGLFTVQDLATDRAPEIVIKLDAQRDKKTLLKQKVKTDLVCLSFHKNSVSVRDLNNANK